MRLAAAAAALQLFAIGNDAERLDAHGDQIDVAAPNWYAVDRGGRVSGAPNPEYRSVADAHGTEVWPVVNARLGFRGRWLTARPRAVARQIARVAAGFDGVTLDVEEIPPRLRARYSAFVADVARRTRGGVAVYTVRRTAGRPLRSAAAYDHRALARSADLLLASAYGEHSPSSAPGPLTTRPGLTRVLDYASQGDRPLGRGCTPQSHGAGAASQGACPLGWWAPVLGGFGVAWPLFGGGPGRVVSTDGLPDGTDHVVRDGEVIWYGTGAALRAQRDTVWLAGLRWVALFSLGREPAGFWNGAHASAAVCPASLRLVSALRVCDLPVHRRTAGLRAPAGFGEG